MLKKTIAFLVLSTVAFGHGWPSGYYPSYYRNYNYYPGVSGGTATAIGIGAGVVGFIIGNKTASKKENSQKIECEDFPVKVVVEGKETIGTVKKCRVNGGPWQIP